jgi:hypothetical protein
MTIKLIMLSLGITWRETFDTQASSNLASSLTGPLRPLQVKSSVDSSSDSNISRPISVMHSRPHSSSVTEAPPPLVTPLVQAEAEEEAGVEEAVNQEEGETGEEDVIITRMPSSFMRDGPRSPPAPLQMDSPTHRNHRTDPDVIQREFLDSF